MNNDHDIVHPITKQPFNIKDQKKLGPHTHRYSTARGQCHFRSPRAVQTDPNNQTTIIRIFLQIAFYMSVQLRSNQWNVALIKDTTIESNICNS